MLGKSLYNMLGQRLYNMLGQRFLDEQSADGFASRNQHWPNENCSLRPNVGPTSTCYLGFMKDGKTVNCNGGKIIGLIHLKYGKKRACQDNFFTVNAGFSKEGGKRSTSPSDILTSDDRKEADLHLQRGSITRGIFRDIL